MSSYVLTPVAATFSKRSVCTHGSSTTFAHEITHDLLLSLLTQSRLNGFRGDTLSSSFSYTLLYLIFNLVSNSLANQFRAVVLTSEGTNTTRHKGTSSSRSKLTKHTHSILTKGTKAIYFRDRTYSSFVFLSFFHVTSIILITPISNRVHAKDVTYSTNATIQKSLSRIYTTKQTLSEFRTIINFRKFIALICTKLGIRHNTPRRSGTAHSSKRTNNIISFCLRIKPSLWLIRSRFFQVSTRNKIIRKHINPFTVYPDTLRVSLHKYYSERPFRTE